MAQGKSAWAGKTRRAASQRGSDTRVYRPATAARDDMSTRDTPKTSRRFAVGARKTRRAPLRHCRDSGVYGQTTTAMHDNQSPPPPLAPFGLLVYHGQVVVTLIEWSAESTEDSCSPAGTKYTMVIFLDDAIGSQEITIHDVISKVFVLPLSAS